MLSRLSLQPFLSPALLAPALLALGLVMIGGAGPATAAPLDSRHDKTCTASECHPTPAAQAGMIDHAPFLEEGCDRCHVELAHGEEKPVGEPASVEAAATAATNPGWQVSVGPRVDGYATVLSLSRNPAIPVIYVACGVMMIGLLLGFFVPRREVFFLAEGGELRVVARYRHPAKELDTATRSILAKLTAAPAANS